MLEAKIVESGFFSSYGERRYTNSFAADRQDKVVMLEEGQRVRVMGYIGNDRYACTVIKPSLKCADQGGFHGMGIVVYENAIEMDK